MREKGRYGNDASGWGMWPWHVHVPLATSEWISNGLSISHHLIWYSSPSPTCYKPTVKTTSACLFIHRRAVSNYQFHSSFNQRENSQKPHGTVRLLLELTVLIVQSMSKMFKIRTSSSSTMVIPTTIARSPKSGTGLRVMLYLSPNTPAVCWFIRRKMQMGPELWRKSNWTDYGGLPNFKAPLSFQASQTTQRRLFPSLRRGHGPVEMRRPTDPAKCYREL